MGRDGVADSRDTTADGRDTTAVGRDTTADGRDTAADGRDGVAELRDQLAELRDQVAELRDEVAERRDRAADSREDRAAGYRAGAAIGSGVAAARREAERVRDHASAGRDAAARERQQAGLDRDDASSGRDVAADRREQAGLDRDDASSGRDVAAGARQRAELFRESASTERQSRHLESIGELAGRVAHVFNNLMAGITNYAALVADSVEEQTPEPGDPDDEAFATLKRDVEEIIGMAARAAAVTNQMLAFSGRNSTSPEVMDLNALVLATQTRLRAQLANDIELEVVLEPGLPRITADRGQFAQVLLNLAVNAGEAMPAGGRLRIATARSDIDDSDGRDPRGASGSSQVRLMVSDTGVGMTRAVAIRAMEPFFTTKSQGQGMGLGLATVFGIVTQAGGEVVLDSAVGRGTSVLVSLPASPRPPGTPARAPGVPASPMGRGETILLVDDESMVREPIRRILVKNGYKVLEASDADEAMQVAAQYDGQLALLLTDVIMPGRSGKELATEILRYSPTTKILYMSGYSANVFTAGGVLDEGVRLIAKPFTTPILLEWVRKLLSERHPSALTVLAPPS